MAGTPAAEVDVTVDLVRTLLADQHPDLAHLPLTWFANGWDNAMLRLGDHLLVRLPRRRLAAELVEHEQVWLPELAHRLPVRVPVAVRAGRPGAGYPWAWSVLPWTDGVPLSAVPVAGRGGTAEPLARTLAALHAPAPAHVWTSPFRGNPLHPRDDLVRGRLAELADLTGPDAVDDEAAARLTSSWQAAVAAPPLPDPRLWVHGDVHPLNLLVDGPAGTDGADSGPVSLAAVIDWGDVTAGDPACDLAIAWLGYDADDGARFRATYDAAVTHDLDLDALWTRARGWAVHLGVMLALGSDDQPDLFAVGRHAVHRLGDLGD